jgi:hypothetical protein
MTPPELEPIPTAGATYRSFSNVRRRHLTGWAAFTALSGGDLINVQRQFRR